MLPTATSVPVGLKVQHTPATAASEDAEEDAEGAEAEAGSASGEGLRSGSGGALQSLVFHSSTDASWPRVSSHGLRKLGEKANPLTAPLNRESTATGQPSRSRHTRAVPSVEEETSVALSGDKASSVISPLWPRSVCCSSPVSVLQILMLASSEPVMSLLPLRSQRQQ